MKKENKIHVLCCTDNNFVMQSSVMMQSVICNHEDGAIVFHVIIDNSVTEESKQLLEEEVAKTSNHIQFHLFESDKIKSYPRIGIKGVHVSQASYYRLFISEVLPSDIQRVIYLDGDIIVRHSLQKIWDLDLTGYAIAAVPDGDEGNMLIYNRLHYPFEYGYFNAGVLVVNLEYWHEHDCVRRCADFMTQHPERILLHDQDVLNAVFYKEKYNLPIKYNVQMCYFFRPEEIRIDYNFKYKKQVEEASSDPYILHFSSFEKPWVRTSHLPYQREFRKYYALTPWGNKPLASGKSLKYYLRKILESVRIMPRIPSLPYDDKFKELFD